MNAPENYLDVNKDAWNKRTAVHVNSDFYNMEQFLAGASSLNATELALLGDVKGKRILHLQCHFGQDSISLARMGATVVGVDLSDVAIKQAQALSEQLHTDASFVCCNVYDVPLQVEGTFDMVFTSYGVLGWLPDLDAWAKVIAQKLKPQGKLILVEFHPFVWMYDAKWKNIQYSYFKSEAIVDETTGTYTDRDAAISYTEVSWNHSLDEVWNALQQHQFYIDHFKEYNFSHYPCFNDIYEKEGKYYIQSFQDKAPIMYSIVARSK
jgi:2-polyprenyl-3-methyl-5-hydroxy-6-metoxy-1,4-benzoquinol methylase